MNAAVGEEPTPSSPEPDTPGELLRRQREQRGLSVQHAAEELHLDTWAIDALENNRFASLGAPVYAKGYLRKYALILGMSPETVIARYEALSDTPPVPVPAPTQQVDIVERISLKKPLLILASLAGAALLVWIATLFLDGMPATAPAPSDPAPSLEQSAPATVGAPTANEVAAAQLVQPDPAQSDMVRAPSASTASVHTATPGGVQVRLRLEFSETSWTEVYDATGRRLMFGLGEPGRVRNLVGVAPVRVTLGAASAVTAQVNDQPIVIPRRAGRDASKFVIDAAGQVATGAAASEQ